jgi:NAD(P)-dependent dehydrogenase (short-subunit alcohol dehydrogenase family)
MPGAVVIGAGPGLGQAIALRFARERFDIALIARSQLTVGRTGDALVHSGVEVIALTADSADASSLRTALDIAEQTLGPPDVVVYNAAVIRRDALGELAVDAQLAAWAVNVVGALTAAVHVAPTMIRNGGGSIIITGGMPTPDPRYVSLSLGKAGVRTLTTMLATAFGRDGLHVATVTVSGPIVPGTAFDPDDIAEHYWRLHAQPTDQWELEVVYAGR